MIIEKFGFDINGNTKVKISNDNGTESFSLHTMDGLPFCHSIRNCHPYKWTDKQKEQMENEIRNYVRKFGTPRQKLIVDYC